MNSTDFKELLQKYNDGICSDEEKLLIESWYMEFNSVEPLVLTDDQIAGIMAMKVPVLPMARQKQVGWWISVAAAILIVTTSALYFSLKQSSRQESNITKVQNDIRPGTDQAILTLASGEKIILNNAQKGVLTNQANAVVNKTDNGHVVYAVGANTIDEPVVFNTMSVPRGGQYHLTLIDGTQVWLNSNSSITFPTRFDGNERKVTVTGEAYFEVAHQAEKPFRVSSKGQVIEVLGTHFNLNAYEDEPSVKTTLLQGSVKVMARGKTEILKPGDQALLSEKALVMASADMEEVMAWHEGDFVFKKQTVEEIMRKVSRWYDIDIDYDHYSPDNHTFTGVISRKKNLSSVIQMMKASTTSLKFQINGKRLLISN
jgi:transmembrane sensor